MFITLALVPILRLAAVQLHVGLDLPDARKVHAHPVPKLGGLAMAVGMLVPAILMADGGELANALLAGATVIVFFGLWDDLKNLGWKAKFLGQGIAAAIVVVWGGLRLCFLGSVLPPETCLPEWVAMPLAILAILGVTNAINLSDGLDGLAGGTSLIAFITLGLIAYTGADFPERNFLILLCCTAAGAIFGFLRFNTHPASVFMGDTGSQLLGFLLITLGLAVTQRETPVSPVSVLLVLGFPVLDTLVVMAERVAAGKSPFKPDRNHFHHKLMRLGLFHTEAVALIYGLTAAMAASAYSLRYHSDWLLLTIWVGISALLVAFFTAAERRGVRFSRQGFLDVEVKGRLKLLKEKRIPIRVSFGLLRWGLPALFLAATILPGEIPRWASGLALGVLVGLLLARLFWRSEFPAVLRGFFFLSVPFVLTHAVTSPVAGLESWLLRGFETAFGVLAVVMVLTLRFTSRRKGFRTTPTDVLILLVALILPNLPEALLEGVKLGNLAVMMIVLFFGYEVAVGEMRGRIDRFAATISASYAVLALRGFI